MGKTGRLIETYKFVAGIGVEGLKKRKKTLSQPHYPLYDSLIHEITRFLWDNLLTREAGQNLCLSYQSVCGTRIRVFWELEAVE
jgi:hypothetical protein